MHVELAAICQGLIIVVDHFEATINIEFESESLEAVILIKFRDIFTQKFSVIISDIRHIFAMKLMFRMIS